MSEEATQAPVAARELTTGDKVTGKVTYLAVYGAMVDIGLERDALLHVSQLKTNNFRNIDDVFSVGDDVEAFVLKVDKDGRVALTEEKPPEVPWNSIKQGQMYRGTVERIEDFGIFVNFGAERPGMVHVSEMADGYVKSPSDVVSRGDDVEVRVLKVNRKKRQIDLSMKTAVEEIEDVLEPTDNIPTAMEIALRRAQQQAQQDETETRRTKKKTREQDKLDDIISRTLKSN
jgi:ribosomal protein S1